MAHAHQQQNELAVAEQILLATQWPVAVPLACHNGPIQGGFSGTRRTVDILSELVLRVFGLPRPDPKAA
jgi:hypothetical protein